MAVRFVVNGKRVEVESVDHHVTLLAWLRTVGLTGSKEACAEGECGACAVAVVASDAAGRTRFDPINSCLVPLPAVHGRTVVTVEGVAPGPGELHPVQREMVVAGGSQCGYCTPGFVVSLFCEYYRPGRSGTDPEAISGNLCRCTGYRPIIDVARRLAPPQPGDPRLDELAVAPAPLGPVDHEHVHAYEHAPGHAHAQAPAPAPVQGRQRFVRPTDLPSLLRLLSEDPQAIAIAGGTDLMVYANQRYERFPVLAAVDAIPELARFEVTPSEVVIGAGLTLTAVEERTSSSGDDPGALAIPMLRQLFPLFSSRLIRNRATLGGNLATASPIGDAAPALLALGAEVTLAARDGARRIPLADLFVGYRKTALRPGEVIVSIHVPRPLSRHQRFYKVSKRVLDDISTVAAAFALDLGADGRVERLRIAYGGVSATPLDATAPVGALAVGRPWDRETLAVLLDAVGPVGTPLSDHRGSAAYRRAMMGRLLEKLFAETASPPPAGSAFARDEGRAPA